MTIEACACPLCRRDVKRGAAKLLYEVPVCKKCYHAFANRRQGAFIIDRIGFQVVLMLFFAMIGFMIGLSGGKFTPGLELAFNIGGWVFFLLFFFKDGFSGYSLGKWLCGVRVVDKETREPIGMGASFKRNLPLIIPIVPLVMAIQMMKGHRIGDKWSKSMVIWTKYEGSYVFGARGTCEKCQYDLIGNTSGVCPECGTPVSEQNKAANEQRAQSEQTAGASPFA